MKNFKLTRVYKYTETLEIKANGWGEAKEILESEIEFNRNEDDMLYDNTIEFIGEDDS